jgi:tetratricopeptide (TPR) repeat protein
VEFAGPLYASDYRVRVYLRRCIEKRVLSATDTSTPTSRNLAFQLALCCSIGFGGAKNNAMAQESLLRSSRSQEDLNQEIEFMYRWDYPPWKWDDGPPKLHVRLDGQGHMMRVALENYRVAGVLYEAEITIRQEIRDIGWHVSEGNKIVTYLADELANILEFQKRWDEAEELFIQVLEIRKRFLGTRHIATLTSMTTLACMYQGCGRLEEAEKLSKQIIEMIKGSNWPNYPDGVLMINMINLELTYKDQGRWDQAEALLREVIETFQVIFGTDHPVMQVCTARLTAVQNSRNE